MTRLDAIRRATADKRTFHFRMYDRRYGGEIGRLGGDSIEASCRTEARDVLARAWKRDTPRDARNLGFCPWSDVRIVWED
jgi:hypothetical protein